MGDKKSIFVVATPIGNLSDITERARDVLAEVDMIACEDTRRSGLLLQRLGLPKKPLISYHNVNETSRAQEILDRVERENLSLALVSDAGTPCISDPGFRMIALARQRGLRVVPVPGVSALGCLISISGLPSNRVLFVGFPPAKEAALNKEIESWFGLGASIVFYEAPRRLGRLLEALSEKAPDAAIFIGRELTKLHEEVFSGTVREASEWVASHQTLKGEAAVMLDLSSHSATSVDPEHLRTQLLQGLQQGLRFKELLLQFRDCGMPRSELYQLLLELKEEMQS